MPGFSIGNGRLAWATPHGQGAEGSRVQIVAWSDDGVGAAESGPGKASSSSTERRRAGAAPDGGGERWDPRLARPARVRSLQLLGRSRRGHRRAETILGRAARAGASRSAPPSRR